MVSQIEALCSGSVALFDVALFDVALFDRWRRRAMPRSDDHLLAKLPGGDSGETYPVQSVCFAAPLDFRADVPGWSSLGATIPGTY
jgi:hypothetical protein